MKTSNRMMAIVSAAVVVLIIGLVFASRFVLTSENWGTQSTSAEEVAVSRDALKSVGRSL